MEDLVSYIDENKQPEREINLTVIRNQTYLDLNVLLGDHISTKSDNSTKSEDAKDPYG